MALKNVRSDYWVGKEIDRERKREREKERERERAGGRVKTERKRQG